MAEIRYLRDEIVIVGWSCRFPGANSVGALWSLLVEGRCTVSQVPPDRFSLKRFGHPRRRERGKSYTWAAGILDDVWGFDPSVFGISPREAEQMDPQQRILLQLTFEALEDAGTPPSSLAGTEAGVFVGASQTDYAHAVFGDQAIADSHFATGNALAILANRISYIYDLHGPSVTLDTACSSSLVALHHAVEALRSGRIDTAIVGGINVIGSPAEFVSFSQASMLSPTGLCRAFSADADGYVRAEGGAVLVLRRGTEVGASPVHGTILASEVNSDGRKGGISLPSGERQEALLSRVYSRAGIDPGHLAFVEAHGTGTPVGDPIEAQALGASLGRARSEPLPIGSIKSNIGHVEAASGLAGLLKALLALDHGILPRSLHICTPNPKIDFEGLNLALCQESLLLTNSRQRCAGVNSFGFGGTNAHVVVACGKQPAVYRSASQASLFAISAATKPALTALAQKYFDRIANLSDEETANVANAVAHRRELMTTRLVISTTRRRDVSEALQAFLAGAENPQVDWGAAAGHDLPVAFVYSGNGSQWPGMGVIAYRRNEKFRAHFDNLDDFFRELAGWSLKDALGSEDLEQRLSLTHVAQPLIFAIQSAMTAALRAHGMRPAAVLGHSVGEIAAAEAAGILDLRTAVEVIFFRSVHQESVRGGGRMAALLAGSETVVELIEPIANIWIAAANSPRVTTVSGPSRSLAKLKQIATDRGIPFLDLDLDYPFHTELMAPVEAPLLADLKHIRPNDGDVPFISTVTGSCLPGLRLDAAYWWRNVRDPVQFVSGIRAAANLGARFFIEIGPRTMLLKHIADSLTDVDGFTALSALDRNDGDRDPVPRVVSKALIGGAQLDTKTIFGPDGGGANPLPSYPWQQVSFRYTPTSEAIGVVEPERHPFSGARFARDGLQWHAHIDTALFPELADHKVGEQVIFPGAGFLEISFAVAREWLQSKQVFIADFEILKPLDLTNGETREIMSRVSPSSNTLEIFSRPRLSQAGWLLHSRGRVLHGNMHAAVPEPTNGADRRSVSAEDIYRLADLCGLHYGPAFRLLESAVVIDDRLIQVELTDNRARDDFVLNPICVDACGHGLLTVFAELRADERGVSYLPVRFDEAALFTPGAEPRKAVIELISRNERAIIGNYYFLGSRDELIAAIRGLRCQAVQVRRSVQFEANAFVELPQRLDGTILGATGLAITGDAVLAEARTEGLLAEVAEPPDDELIEGWATAAAYEIVSALADGSVVDIEGLVTDGRLPAELRLWLKRLLSYLERAGLVENKGGLWLIVDDPLLPRGASVLKELAQKYPHRSAELLLAGAVTGLVEEVTSRGAIAGAPQSRLSSTVLDFYELASLGLKKASAVVERLIGNSALWPKNRSIRVLQIGFGPLTQSLLALSRGRELTVTVFEPDHRRRELAEDTLHAGSNRLLADPESVKALGVFDLVIAVESLHRLTIDLTSLREVLAPQGLLLALEPQPSLFRDLTCGLDSRWFEADPLGRVRSADDWQLRLKRAALGNVQAHVLACDGGQVSLLIAESMPEARRDAPTRQAELRPLQTIIFDDAIGPTSDFAAMLDRVLRHHGADVRRVRTSDFSGPVPATIIHIGNDEEAADDTVEALTTRCLQIKACAERCGASGVKLWLVFRGALPSERSTVRPLATGAWAFSRTLANEFPHLDVRRVDIQPHVPDKTAAALLREMINSGTAETELQIEADGLRAVRADTIRRPLDRAHEADAAAARLQRRLIAGARLQWEESERRGPGPNEVEIAVEATGLNFRDVMWMLALLPDEIIEGGVAGPTLGCECAGRIVQCGAEVDGFEPGERVIAFAPAAFATHVTVPAALIAKLPSELSCEAGATIPVAFLTAYYSLVTQAKLARGEWLLVHGGAGGVGLAAIQIAQMRGARIIASAGSQAKRDLLTALGVADVIDARSTSIVDDVRAIVRPGVDVVLNSLAGEAMERSVACLRPFGRFVELGKRDFASNSMIGLRPFRHNVSYFSIDLDQLLQGRPRVGQKIYAELMRMFAAGTLTPLPYSVFRACDVGQAFHLMQHSGHIGKLVVQPPSLKAVRRSVGAFAVNPNGTHVITGGFGGFGLEVAKWLVERGARHLVLIGRRGAASDEAKATLGTLTARGVAIHAAACDVADRRAMESLFERIHATMPPIVGVLHAAMVLDDGLLSNLDESRFRRVLAPKVKGLDHLDSLTAGAALDYFVMFSSATTLMGNPGQANYVAANAYMEGVARRRRQNGQKALAIGWGPITDVGVLAQSERLRARFQKLTGVVGMRAHEALDLMAQALAQSPAAELAVMTISPTEGLFTVDRLPVLSSPTYMNLATKQRTDAGVGILDLQAIAAAEGVDGLRRKLTDAIVTGVARVLRSRPEEVSLTRPLSEIGLDSLMALEFAMSLEDSFSIHVPLTSAIGTLTVAGIANEIIGQLNLFAAPTSNMVRTIAGHHVNEAEPDQLVILEEIVSEQESVRAADAKRRRMSS